MAGARRSPCRSPSLAAALLFAFAVLVVRHARIEERVAWFDALRLVNQRALARVGRDWDGLPPATPPAGVDLDTPSLRTRSRPLRPRLARPMDWPFRDARWSGVAVRMAARARQTPTRSAPGRKPWPNWRRRSTGENSWPPMACSRPGARPADLDRFFAWAEGPALFSPAGRLAAQRRRLWLTLSIWTLLGLQIAGVVSHGLLDDSRSLPGSSCRLGPRGASTARSTAPAPGSRRCRDTPGSSSRRSRHRPAPRRLRDLRQRLEAEGRSSPECMRRLNRILGFADMRRAGGHLPFRHPGVDAVGFPRRRLRSTAWREHAGRHVRGWIAALGELDALTSLATVAFDNPAWCTPELDPDRRSSRPRGSRSSAAARRSARRQRRRDRPAGHRSGRHRIEHVRQEHAAARRRPQRRPRAGRRPGLRPCASTAAQRSRGEHPGAGLARARALVFHGGAGEVERHRRRRANGRDTAACCFTCSTRSCRGRTAAERSIAVRGIVRHLLDAGAIGAMTTHDLAVAVGTAARQGRTARPFHRVGRRATAACRSTTGCGRAWRRRGTRCG